jgi:hypothetical protein
MRNYGKRAKVPHIVRGMRLHTRNNTSVLVRSVIDPETVFKNLRLAERAVERTRRFYADPDQTLSSCPPLEIRQVV